jgi:hypothetical protein
VSSRFLFNQPRMASMPMIGCSPGGRATASAVHSVASVSTSPISPRRNLSHEVSQSQPSPAYQGVGRLLSYRNGPEDHEGCNRSKSHLSSIQLERLYHGPPLLTKDTPLLRILRNQRTVITTVITIEPQRNRNQVSSCQTFKVASARNDKGGPLSGRPRLRRPTRALMLWPATCLVSRKGVIREN